MDISLGMYDTIILGGNSYLTDEAKRVPGKAAWTNKTWVIVSLRKLQDKYDKYSYYSVFITS